MDRSRIVGLLAWSAAALAAGVVTAVGLLVRGPTEPGDGGVPAEGPGATLTARPERVIPPGPAEAWRRHDRVLSVTAVVGVRGGWLVLDARSAAVHRLDGQLRLVATFGRRGEGPGELAYPAGMTLSGDSLLAVLDAAGSRIDLLTPEGAFVDRLRVRVPGCPVGLSGGILPSGDGFVTWGVCGGPGGGRWAAAAVERDGGARLLATAPLRRDGAIVAPLGRGVVAWRGRVWVGAPDGCFSAVPAPDETSRGGPRRVCLEEAPRPLPDDLRRRLDPPGPPRGAPRVELPDEWPPFVATEWSARGPLLVLPPTPSSPDGAVALLETDGTLTVLRAPDAVWPGPDGFLMTRPLLQGTAFRVVPG